MGDVLVLGKPLGVGVMSAALKKNALGPQGYAQMMASTTKLNTPGPDLAALDGRFHTICTEGPCLPPTAIDWSRV